MEKLFFYQGLISGLILFRKNVQFFYTNMFLDKQIAPQRFLATIANLPNNAWVQNNLDFFWHNSEPSYYSGYNNNYDHDIFPRFSFPFPGNILARDYLAWNTVTGVISDHVP